MENFYMLFVDYIKRRPSVKITAFSFIFFVFCVYSQNGVQLIYMRNILLYFIPIKQDMRMFLIFFRFIYFKYKYSFNISELIIYVSHFTEIVSFHCNKNVAFLYIKIYVYINIFIFCKMLKFKINKKRSL